MITNSKGSETRFRSLLRRGGEKANPAHATTEWARPNESVTIKRKRGVILPPFPQGIYTLSVVKSPTNLESSGLTFPPKTCHAGHVSFDASQGGRIMSKSTPKIMPALVV